MIASEASLLTSLHTWLPVVAYVLGLATTYVFKPIGHVLRWWRARRRHSSQMGRVVPRPRDFGTWSRKPEPTRPGHEWVTAAIAVENGGDETVSALRYGFWRRPHSRHPVLCASEPSLAPGSRVEGTAADLFASSDITSTLVAKLVFFVRFDDDDRRRWETQLDGSTSHWSTKRIRGRDRIAGS